MAQTAAYLQLRIDALYTLLEQMELSPIGEYITDNSGVRQQVTYRAMDEIRKTIDWLERKLAKVGSGPMQRVLCVKRSME